MIPGNIDTGDKSKVAANSPEAGRGPLSGVVVLDLTENLPGPLATLVLAQLGASVLKLERPAGDGSRAHPLFRLVQAGKMSVIVDLKTEQDVEFVRSLARKADVFIEGFRPGVVNRLGVDFESIARENDKIIYCSLSGYGSVGFMRDRMGHDITYLAATGVLFGNRQAGLQIVACPPGHSADTVAGLLAATTILGQLVLPRSRRSAVHLDVAIADAAAIVDFASFAELSSTDDALPREAPHYRLFETLDDRHVAIGITPPEDAAWRNLARLLGRHDLVDLNIGERIRRRAELEAVLAGAFREHQLAHWEKVLEPLDIPWAPVLAPAEVLERADTARPGVLGSQAATLDLFGGGAIGAAPELGEHTAVVHAWLDRATGG